MFYLVKLSNPKTIHKDHNNKYERATELIARRYRNTISIS